MTERFVNIAEIQEWLKVRETMNKNISTVNPNHCRDCGDSEPKHGFYPLLGMAVGEGIYQTSSLLCNRCAWSDEEYEQQFGEPKEIISFEQLTSRKNNK